MRNMILAVGPGTPASICWKSDEEDDATSQEGFILQDSDDDSDEDNYVNAASDDEEAAEEKEDEQKSDSDERDNTEDEMDDDDDDSGSARRSEQAERRREVVRRTLQERIVFRRMFEAGRRMFETEQESDEDAEIPMRHDHHRGHQHVQRRTWVPSIRHGGCINTACWLDCPWRLSSAGSVPQAVESYESPTQIITSGDDRLIKFWDVRNAMGMASPLPGGWDTFAPLALGTDSDIGSTEIYNTWRNYYKQCDKFKVAGSVNLLASLTSGHRGNVFHVTPIGGAPGKVLTCGADGYLRASDLHSQTSSIVVNHFAFGDTFDSHGGMAFSHQMLTRNTGLMCSERGLHHFDLRLSPREQQRQSLLKSQLNAYSFSNSRTLSCKACAVWSPHHSPKGEIDEPTLVFAGGASEYVELLDLRMDGSRKKVIQRYKPRCLSNSGNVSVSGLDVSKDGRELLVSYESDQIYTFPVFHEAASLAGPSLDEIDAASTKFSESHEEFLSELASYGGHLNRFTFLKNAKYAGPNDEFILTGSDSGKAWIYERKSGCVTSLLSADSSTCNGVIPHPSLPFFITYGIDSTAKLWRSARCVDPNVSDSPSARAKASLDVPYEMSPVTKSWDGVQALVRRFDEVPTILPDLVASAEEMASSGRFSSQAAPEICGEGSARFGNSLRCLPSLLRQTRFECYRARHDGRTVPVEQPLELLTVRVSLNRLQLQAARFGLRVNPLAPWTFEGSEDSHIHNSDLVPDSPSDWLLFDKQMTENPLDVQMHFNLKDYGDVLRRTFPESTAFFQRDDSESLITVPWLIEEQQNTDEEMDTSSSLRIPSDDVCSRGCKFGLKSRKLLYETAALLKEGGNHAMKEGFFQAAARRYDKAIQYCAVVFMQYHEGMTSLKHLTDGHHVELAALKHGDQVRPANAIVVWSPLLRILITARLNMSLLLCKPEFAQPDRASEQARAALKLLFPFARKEGKVVVILARGGDKTEHVVTDQEPVETFREAKALQAKAYFRLGSAEFDMEDYSASVKSFELSLKSSSASSPNIKPDSLLVRRLHEAKRKSKARKKRARKKFQQLLGDHDERSAADPGED
jgi:tetratricopeptide (TPR) repeat protein